MLVGMASTEVFRDKVCATSRDIGKRRARSRGRGQVRASARGRRRKKGTFVVFCRQGARRSEATRMQFTSAMQAMGGNATNSLQLAGRGCVRWAGYNQTCNFCTPYAWSSADYYSF